METIPFTHNGLESLRKELDNLKMVERPKVISQVAEARSHGDLKENAEYHAAREKQGFLEGKIAELEDKISRAQVIDIDANDTSTVRFGAWVTLSDEDSGEEKKYRIVGDLESDITLNFLSISSPMARALLGKSVDDLVEIKAPKGKKEFMILKIEY